MENSVEYLVVTDQEINIICRHEYGAEEIFMYGPPPQCTAVFVN